jgi:hypothetical protein
MTEAKAHAHAWLASALGFAALLAGCAVRSPEMYRDDIRKLLENKRPILQACYEAELQVHPDAGGKVIVRFAVESSSGRIQSP